MTEVTTIAFWIFVISLTIVFIGASYYLYTQYKDNAKNNIQIYEAPTAVNCPAVICPSGQTPRNVTLTNGNFETINYCSVQAPSTSYIESLEVCAGTSQNQNVQAPDASSVTAFAEYYDEYTNTCGKSWKGKPSLPDQRNVAQKDQIIIALQSCAAKLGITNNSNINNLVAKNESV